MAKYIMIAMGGAGGAVLRFLVSGVFYNPALNAFPWGTLIVNGLGSLLLGLFLGFSPGQNKMYFFLVVGLLGAFTTFSTFSYETIHLLRIAAVNTALINIAANVLFSLSAVLGGYYFSALLR
ncbi:MAG: fluoride efflux transporter CrcB [FCB group bacterium]|nr:fluoride efflux transporter CrcB [FCB group bacterium]